jgi:serine protease Do
MKGVSAMDNYDADNLNKKENPLGETYASESSENTELTSHEINNNTMGDSVQNADDNEPIEKADTDSNIGGRSEQSSDKNEFYGDQNANQDAYDLRNEAMQEPNPLKTPSYYSENYKNEGKRKNNTLTQILLVSVISAIIGGTVVGVFFQFVTPALSGYFTKDAYNNGLTDSVAAQDNASSGVKKVEIQKTDSPVTAIAEKSSPSIVGIRVTINQQANSYNFFFNSNQAQSGEGSGIILRSDGYIMTNNHVISGALEANSTNKIANGAKIEVILPQNINKSYTAQVIGTDATTDLAVIKINATGLPVAELGNSDNLKVGDLVVAIGNPGGLEYMGSVTSGVVSGLNRTIQGDGNSDAFKLIQTDAAINPGNSGGALLNSQGQVVGINSEKIVSQGYEGLGFAIPINKAKEVVDSLIQYKYVKGRPVLGIMIDQSFNEDVAKQYNVPAGLLVQNVTPLSGAYKAGVQAGDIVTKFDGKSVKIFSDLNNLKNKHKVGDVVSLQIYRDGKTLTVRATLTENKG